jgi:hypothetical protein
MKKGGNELGIGKSECPACLKMSSAKDTKNGKIK